MRTIAKRRDSPLESQAEGHYLPDPIEDDGTFIIEEKTAPVVIFEDPRARLGVQERVRRDALVDPRESTFLPEGNDCDVFVFDLVGGCYPWESGTGTLPRLPVAAADEVVVEDSTGDLMSLDGA